MYFTIPLQTFPTRQNANTVKYRMNSGYYIGTYSHETATNSAWARIPGFEGIFLGDRITIIEIQKVGHPVTLPLPPHLIPNILLPVRHF